ncbi:ABC transporter permease [Bacillus sp. PS06]|uniref:ABC transporter permease n=1 Tax=Bacillus sp. PS06 TaxID=2764176 RepID=UPI001780FC70|nr:ABC transporter permease [Bacillus sp. PS06]MBD8067715.1 ABC transporter permease [Bacillus sp. PS06]
MVNTQDLWKKRFTQFTTEVKRYLRYMLNDHLLIALIFFTGGAAYYYNQWLADLPPNIPYLFIISLILALFLTSGSVQTLLKDPDLVFLLPIEKKLGQYFQKAFIWSAIFQGYILLLIFAIITPLYLSATNQSFAHLAVIFLIVVLNKVWNLTMSWNLHFLQDTISKFVDLLIRFFLNLALCYFLFSHAPIYFTIAVIVIMLCLLMYFYKARTEKGLKWDMLIELESKRMMTFYRLANLFTDVPKLKEQIKRRSWLNWLTSFTKYEQDRTFTYLYLRTFLRSSDYLGMFIRLTLIGGVALTFLPMGYGKIAIGILFLYLTGYQLITLWRHHHLKIWLDLYPISLAKRTRSFLHLMMSILFVQMLLFCLFIIFTGQLTFALFFLGAGAAFVYLFVYHYVKLRLIKLS